MAAEVLRRELDDSGDARLKAFADRLRQRLRAADRNDESQARALARDLVLALAGGAADQACAAGGGGCVLRLAADRRGRRRLRHAAARARSARDRGAGGAAFLSAYSFPKIASTSATCARKPTAKASVRSTGMPSV